VSAPGARMLSLIGLGLGHPKDLSYRAVEAIRAADDVFLEAYTSIMIDGAVEDLEAFLGKTVAVADREAVESGAVLDPCRAGRRVALIVVGDPLSATTHSDLVVRCHELGVPCRVVHNASVLTAVAQSGLQLYRFGETISLCFWTDTFRPDSWYPKAARNKAAGLHTLCLLDIKVKELTDEQLARPKARSLFDAAPSGPPKPRFMTIAEAIDQMLAVEEKHGQGVCGPDSLAAGLARLGGDTQRIATGHLRDLRTVDFGGPLHCLVLAGDISEPEGEHFDLHRWPPAPATP
jgi:diphthine synthase